MAVAIATAWMAVLACPAGAVAGEQTTMLFRLPASNGYTLRVKTEGDLAQVSVLRSGGEGRSASPTPSGVHGLHASATYYVDEAVAAGAIDADLGALGAIHVRFVPSGEVRTLRLEGGEMHPSCRAPIRLRRSLGTFEGTIAFRGENGFTAVDATQALGMLGPSVPRRCQGLVLARRAGAPPLPNVEHVWVKSDAILFSRNVSTRNSSNMTSFQAWTTGEGIRYLVTRFELLPTGISVRRYATVAGPGAGFTYSRDLAQATLQPPEPFSGEATYTRIGRRLRGDLAVDLPGLERVPLAGRPFEARVTALR